MKRKLEILLISVLLAACGGKAGPSPMKGEAIHSTSRFTMAILNLGSALDRTLLEQCPASYPGLEVLDDTAVHRAARNAGVRAEGLLAFGETFPQFERIQGFQLLLIAFRSGKQDYLRTVNYLGGYVSTVLLDIPRPRCDDIFRAQRLIVIDSVPPMADVKVDGREIGEAPAWVWLRDGKYKTQCVMQGHTFKPVTVAVPQASRAVCMREEVNPKTAAEADQMEPMSAEEKAGSILVYIVGAAASLAAIIIPILFLL
ncbi:MAG: PEGA domain-containing protein [Pseudomonadota bacterium]